MISGDTIAAIATAPGRGGVAVVRVSGPEALQVAARLTGNRFQVSGFRQQVSGNRFQVLRVNSPRACALQPETCNLQPETFIDECVVLFFRAPHSYTGEDVVEFQCHGGTVTPRRVLEACFAAGARLARRGEFTERAFLNGKLDYDQAESVLDLVDAKTARAADAALEGLAGRKRRELKELYEQALELSAQLEHALDFDENELPADFVANLVSRVSRLKSSLDEAIRRAHEGRLLREGALVVLAGPPNAGKSSLMNALLRENRAIVSDVPGTTRDSIEEWMDLDGWPIRLVDTAGLRETADALEGEGVKRAEDLIARADVVLFLTASGSPEVPGLPAEPGLPAVVAATFLSPRTLGVRSKCDLARGEGLNVSAKTGEGLEELARAIVAKLEERVASAADEGDAASVDVAALHEALAALGGTAGGRESGGARREEDLVLLANAVRRAAERLGSAVGAVYSSDLLDNLFSRFCVGK